MCLQLHLFWIRFAALPVALFISNHCFVLAVTTATMNSHWTVRWGRTTVWSDIMNHSTDLCMFLAEVMTSLPGASLWGSKGWITPTQTNGLKKNFPRTWKQVSPYDSIVSCRATAEWIDIVPPVGLHMSTIRQNMTQYNPMKEMRGWTQNLWMK